MADVTALAVWEKQHEETPKSYAAFTKYRDLGPTRSLAKAAAIFYGMPVETGAKPHQVRQLAEWSRANRWVQRVAAWDVEEDRKLRVERAQQAKDARERAIRGAQLAQRVGLLGMKQISERFGNAEEHPSSALLAYYKQGVELEFLALGMPISVIRQEIEQDVADPADQDRRELLNRASDVLRRR